MNKINFQQSLGFPLETDTLNAMQDCWKDFNAFGEIVAPLAIIKGCAQTGNNVADGFVYINGELLFFLGGITQEKVIIVENRTQKDFEDGNSHDVYFERYATFGVGTVQYDWADFKRGMPTADIPAALNEKEDKTTITAIVNALVERIEDLEARPVAPVPIGLVAIWGLSVDEIPAGWVEHSPLRGRVPVGHDPDYLFSESGDDTDYKLNIPDQTGGVREVQLTEAHLPKIDKTFNANTNISFGNGTAPQMAESHANGNGQEIKVRVQFGNDEAHTNMQPYRIVEYIRYVGL